MLVITENIMKRPVLCMWWGQAEGTQRIWCKMTCSSIHSLNKACYFQVSTEQTHDTLCQHLGPGYTRDSLPAYSFVSRARARRDTTRQDCFVVIPAHTGVTIGYCVQWYQLSNVSSMTQYHRSKRVFFGYGRRKSEDGTGYIPLTATDC